MKEINFYQILAIGVFSFLGFLSENMESHEKKRELLRVWPSYRPEECEWAIRKFICLRCLKNKKFYAQKIKFDSEDRPFRIHGCYTEETGFLPIPEGRDHPTTIP